MRRKGVPSENQGFSLFPFLAVLVCTMGALIVLLMLVVQQARVQASVVTQRRSKDRRQSAAEAERLRELQEDYQWRREILEKQRSEQLQTLARRRLELSHLEDHIRSLEQKWQELGNSVAEMERAASSDRQDLDTARAELERVRGEIDVAARQLQQARDEAARRPRSYALIPYEGPHGTRRRPIYVECLADSIVLQPEGVALLAEDFNGPLGPGNPLDAALRATREYWLRHGAATTDEPYPLLVVRPDGVTAYAVARAAMSSWDDEFGYELVGEDIRLAYPQADPALADILKKTVAEARQRQAILAAAMPNRFPNHEIAGFRAANGRGGLIPIGDPDLDDDWNLAANGSGKDQRRPETHVARTTEGTSDGPSRQSGGSPAGGNDQGGTAHGTTGGHNIASGQSLAAAKGKDWGLPNKESSLTPITRPIRVLCSAHQLVIVPERNEQRRIVTPLHGSVRDSIDEFVSHIWKRMERWGIAVAGGYWKPVLQVDVAPGGEQRFAELQILLADSGIEVERKRR